MMTKNTFHNQQELELVMLEQLVKDDHLLRKIAAVIDFDFIYDIVSEFYSELMGRESIDPVVLFKMELIQMLFGIRSIRALCEEVHHNMAYRWFLGYGITTKIPDHSVFSQNKIRRFTGSEVYKEIFEHIVNEAIALGLVKGKIIYTDSTHVRANASNSKYENEKVEVIEYKNKHLDRVNKIRERHGIKPLKELDDKVIAKRKKVSKTDSDSGYMHRERKPKGFYYLDHRTVDSSYNIILDAFITAGNVHDSIPYLDRVDYILDTYDFPKKLKYTCADAGYFTNRVLLGVKERGLYPVIGTTKHPKRKGKDSKYWFSFDILEDCYICREGELLEYKTTDRSGYNIYRSDPDHCSKCPRKENCVDKDKEYRTVRRHIDDEFKDEVREFLKTEKGKGLYGRRSETIERSFGDSKELHGYRYASFRGVEKMQMEAYMVATAQNIKKIAIVIASREG